MPTIARASVTLPTSTSIPSPVSDARRRAREVEPLSADRFGVHFTADAELRDLIERARAFASHRLPNGDLASLMKLVVASFIRQEEKRRFGIGAKPRRAKTTSMPACSVMRDAPPGGVPMTPAGTEPTPRVARAVLAKKHGRYLAVAVRREAHARDGGQCSFVSTTGRRYTARAFLEFDHIEPFAKSGASDALNIRLLCKAHNLLHARSCFGALHIAAKIAIKKRRDAAMQSRNGLAHSKHDRSDDTHRPDQRTATSSLRSAWI